MIDDDVSIDELREAVEHVHGVPARFVEAVEVGECFRGEDVWQGAVKVFEFVGHRQRLGRPRAGALHQCPNRQAECLDGGCPNLRSTRATLCDLRTGGHLHAREPTARRAISSTRRGGVPLEIEADGVVVARYEGQGLSKRFVTYSRRSSASASSTATTSTRPSSEQRRRREGVAGGQWGAGFGA